MDWEYHGDFRYHISSTGDSSVRHGPCEICGKHAAEVYFQVEEMHYRITLASGKIREGYTRYGCKSYFGHYDCLVKARREKAV
ncbi:hypothetical protein [Carboxydothermus pertinax]|uniref:Uncharacterized protein n=1 Tax=Carboxydothermus pertinax TaxID=870242 RepID=A0A1L8CRR1_9THEO|nr:hypothetical protein [Carboxydothermus pertinax]GAV21587.1 hypothetical protein cpu_00970 [Carboxydothermus pertinax]